jgi:hypothetical protein
VGIPGPHRAIGKLAVADWWLTIAFFGVEEEREAAAKPARTIMSAKARTYSFIVGNPFKILLYKWAIWPHI